jgi:hypothetical protein
VSPERSWFDGERLLDVLERLVETAQPSVDDAKRLEGVGVRLLIPGLDRLAHRLVERCQCFLYLAASDQHPAERQPCGDVLWISLERGRQMFSGEVE